jgi:hypothetical protein
MGIENMVMLTTIQIKVHTHGMQNLAIIRSKFS